MTKPLKVTIKGAGEAGANAPTVDDLFGQIRDIVDVLEGVEKAVIDDHTNQIIWRVTDAERQNPIVLELTPFATNPAIYIDPRAERVERAVMEGFRSIGQGNARPAYFNDEMLAKARKIHKRVTNGLATTTFAADEASGIEPVIVDVAVATIAERALEAAQSEVKPFKSIGSVEGFVIRAELDGYGRAIMRIRSRMDGSEVKAIASGSAFRQVEEMKLGEVWEGIRVRVYGTVHHKSLKVIDHIEADSIGLLDREQLPGIDDIVDPNFTGGLSTEDYLAELRGA